MDSSVAVVMSVYNGEETLCNAIESILNQDTPFAEFLVIDDGSTDSSVEIVKKYGSKEGRLQYVHNGINRGLSWSLNSGIFRTSAPLIMRMDQDDISTSNRLGRLQRMFEDHSKLVLVSSFVDPIFESSATEAVREGVHRFELKRRNLTLRNGSIHNYLEYENAFHHGEVMFRRSAWKAAGGYRIEFPMAEDYDLWLRMRDFGELAIVDDVLYLRRFSSSNNSTLYERVMDFSAGLARECAYIRSQGKQDGSYADERIRWFCSANGLEKLYRGDARQPWIG